MVERNTIVGIDFLVIGFVLAALGYILVQSISIAAIGFDIAILGALILLIVPEPVPHDAYKALVEDSISNIEIILEESHLEQRAYFIPAVGGRKQVRAFIPAATSTSSYSTLRHAPAALSSPADQSSAIASSSSPVLELVQTLAKSPAARFVSSYGNGTARITGLLLVPPGNEIARLSKVQEGDELEDALRSALISFSDLASSVMLVEEEKNNVVVEEDEERKEGGRREPIAVEEVGTPQSSPKTLVKINISNPKLAIDSPFFNRCLGSPLSCIAGCVVATAKGKTVMLVDEKIEGNLIHLTLETIG